MRKKKKILHVLDLHKCWFATNWSNDIFLRSRREFWENLLPASGRPKCPSMATAADDYEQLETK